MTLYIKIIFSRRQLRSNQAGKALSTPPLFCIKAGYTFSFYWEQTLIPQRQGQRNLQTNLSPLVSSHRFTFPQFVALKSLKLLYFALSFLYKFTIVLC